MVVSIRRLQIAGRDGCVQVGWVLTEADDVWRAGEGNVDYWVWRVWMAFIMMLEVKAKSMEGWAFSGVFDEMSGRASSVVLVEGRKLAVMLTSRWFHG